jgi:hypothetical protein
MAALYGRIQGNRGEATRMGHDVIYARLETWEGSVAVNLFKDGTFTVHKGSKTNPTIPVAEGNVNDN